MTNFNYKSFFLLLLASQIISGCESNPKDLALDQNARPNILFAIADDWGWPDAGAYGLPVVQTPAFDRLASNGILFNHAYVSSPSCTPSRTSILTGKHFWNTGTAANLYGNYPDSEISFQEILEDAGYETGWKFKGWGPGVTETKGRQILGREFDSFDAFLSQRDTTKPFSFWLGSGDPHRAYTLNSGRDSGMDLSKIQVPLDFPDSPEVRGDIADYLWEVQRFDTLIANTIETLEKLGELDNTLILVTGDHGMPFPRHKGNLYDLGTRVPLVAHWPMGIRNHATSDSFISLIDIAPTLLEVAGADSEPQMEGKSFTRLFESNPETYDERDAIHFGRERHVVAQALPDSGGYPMRGIRTKEFLYIQNFEPEKWPAGTPDYMNASIPGAWYTDIDGGPTKDYIFANRENGEKNRNLFAAAFEKRPAEELYQIETDPGQLNNLADLENFADIKSKLRDQLHSFLRESGDPRILGDGAFFDQVRYTGGAVLHPDFQ